MTRIHPALIVALALAALPVRQASALSCAEVIRTPDVQLLPADLETEVPIDTLVWVVLHDYSSWRQPPAPTVTVTDSAGDAVSGSLDSSLAGSTGAALAWTPTEAFEPESDYRVEVTWEEGEVDDLTPMEATFTTGDEVSGAAPREPVVMRIETETEPNEFQGWSCPSYLGSDRAVVEIDSAGRVNLLAWAEDGAPPADPFDGVADARADSTLGIHDELPPATRLRLHVGTFDLAGNFSGWSDEVVTTMPAAGCQSSQELGPVVGLMGLLLLGGGLLRRLDGRALLPLLLVAALALPSLAPDTAMATEPAATIESPESPPHAPGDWRAPLARQLEITEKVWGGALIATGGVQLGFAIGLPFRAPGALSGTVATPIGWGGALGGLLTARILRHHLERSESPERLRKRLLIGYAITTPITIVVMGLTIAGGVFAGVFADNHLGISTGMLGLPMSLLALNVTMGVYAEKIRVMQKHGVASTPRRPRPQLVAAGPTGVVISF